MKRIARAVLAVSALALAVPVIGSGLAAPRPIAAPGSGCPFLRNHAASVAAARCPYLRSLQLVLPPGTRPAIRVLTASAAPARGGVATGWQAPQALARD